MNVYKQWLTAFAVLLLLSACNQKAGRQDGYTSKDAGLVDPVTEKGFKLLKQHCTACHQPYTSNVSGIAPSLPQLKSAYLENNQTEIKFVNAMTAFLIRPSSERSQMKEWVATYGLMPKMDFDSLQYRQIASYLYHADLTSADWFEQESSRITVAVDADKNYLAKGKKLALATKSVLGSNLLKAIKEGGTKHAVEFCNVKAIPLTDSMQHELGVRIRRVSDKPRNPANKANSEQLEYIALAKKELANGQKPSPLVTENEMGQTGYYPIVTGQMCLQCHGLPGKDIKPETMARIEQLYPGDGATGYGENQLRGIWVIDMPDIKN